MNAKHLLVQVSEMLLFTCQFLSAVISGFGLLVGQNKSIEVLCRAEDY